MAHLYFTRHGQTIWNVENKICGATDIALTAFGREQAQILGKQILEERLSIDEILYSPLIRARDTALAVAEITGIPAREERRLTEQNFGKYESTPRDGAEFQEAKRVLSIILRVGRRCCIWRSAFIICWTNSGRRQEREDISAGGAQWYCQSGAFLFL